MEQPEFSCVASRNVTWHSRTLENSLAVFYKVKHTLTLGVSPTGMKTCVHTNTITWMPIAALFIIAPN